MVRVVIIIPVYNGRQYLPDLLCSLKRHESAGIQREILVCDDKSSDNAVEFIKNSCPEVRVIEGEKNLGYAGNVNRGLSYAIKSDFNYAVILNQDVEVEKNWLEPLVREMKDDGSTAAAQPLVLYNDKETVQAWGNEVHFLGFGFSGGNLQKVRSTNSELRTREVTYTTGSAMIMRMSVIREVGMLDEDLEMYHEDLEWCLRARLQGYRMMLVPESRVYHKYEFERSIKKYYFMERNRFIVMVEYYKFLTLLAILPAFIVMETGLLFFSLIRGFWRERLKAYFWFFCHLEQVYFKRLKIQKQR